MPNEFYQRRFGDRRDGRLLRSLSPVSRLMPYLMIKRNDASNLFSDSVEISGMEQWFQEKRQENWTGMGILHLFIAAYVRTVARCPGLNRFVSGQKVYARNQIEVVFVVRRAMTAQTEETSVKVVFSPTDTVFDVYRKLGEKIDEIRAEDTANRTERFADTLLNFPGVTLKFVIWLFNLLDYFGLLPQRLLNISPFHGSMMITDLGSLGTSPIYHHLYHFGNLPIFVAFGAKRRVLELDEDGIPVEHRYIDYKAVMDGRTVDDGYFANALKYMKYYLKNPTELESPPERIEDDIP